MKQEIIPSSKQIRCSADLTNAELSLLEKLYKKEFKTSYSGYAITVLNPTIRDTLVWTVSVTGFDAWKKYYEYMRGCYQVNDGINLVGFVQKELKSKSGARLVEVRLVPKKKRKK